MKEQVNINLDGLVNKTNSINPKKKHSRAKKVLVITFLALFVLSVGMLAALPPLILDDMVNRHVNFKNVYTAEQYGISSNKLSLTTTDNVKIAAYEVTAPSPKAVVIFLSGIHNPSVTAFYGHSAMLKKNGYSSVLCEMRAHGESEGEVICAGYKEYLDTRAVVDYIKENETYKDVPIVVYGLSMGGATAINSVGEIPDIDGLISMSAFSSWENVFADNMVNMGIPKFICSMEKPFVKLYSGIKYGFNSLKISPKNEIKKLGNRPALIYHSEGDSEVPFSSYERIMSNASGNIVTWVKEGDFHFPTENFDNPELDEEYYNQVMGFLEKNFPGKQK